MRNQSLLVKPKDGTEVDVSDMNGVSFFGMPLVTPQRQRNTQSFPNRDGEYSTEITRFGGTTYQAEFVLEGDDHGDIVLIQQAFHRLFFATRDLVRVRDTLESDKMMYVQAQPVTPTMISPFCYSYSIPLLNPAGLRQSIFYSDDADALTKSGGVNMGFPPNEVPMYHFRSSRFRVYNPSDVAIDPLRQGHTLRIDLHGVGRVRIQNTTNGSEVTYKKRLKKGDLLQIDGVHVLKNHTHVGRDTDFGTIVLSKGWNTFEVKMDRMDDIRFHFPFLYL